MNDTLRVAGGAERIEFTLASEGVALEDVVVEGNLSGNFVKRDGIVKGEMISFAGLCKMACCNLAESFENSASLCPTPFRAHGRSRCSAWQVPIPRSSTKTARSCAG